MICVSIGRETHDAVIQEHRSLAGRGVQLVELRLDWLTELPDLEALLRNRPTPVIVTCRRQSDRGHWRHSEAARRDLLREAIAAGVEYVDLEDDVAAEIVRQGPTRRIVSRHDFERTPDKLDELHRRMCGCDADVVKLVTMAETPRDAVRMLQVVDRAEIPTAGFCMGEFGVLSRVLCGRYGSPLTYATAGRDQQTAPGQLTFEEMRDLYRYESIDRETEIFGVLGDPIAHSLSPLIHNTAFRQAGLNAVYLPLRIASDDLNATLDAFEWLGIRGYSVTIPHKQGVLGRAEGDLPVREIGAANTLFSAPDGRWRATNTDYSAALAGMALGLGQDAPRDVPEVDLRGTSVLMLGAGGVARAVGLGVVRSGGKLTITNRTAERAKALARDLGCPVLPWDERGRVSPDVLVNCTAVGMHPRENESPYPAEALEPKTLVFDTVYTPEETLMLRQAKERGCRTVSGLEMFVRQAAVQYELFTGQAAPLEQMRQALRTGLAARG